MPMSTSVLARSPTAEYTLRMNRVLNHIDQHLDTPLELVVLAEVAHFSAFHFHRMFSAWMGETLGDYVRRRRLEMAALQLAGNARVSVLEVALGVGFGSGEAFARAFKLHFRQTPTAWRANTPQRWACELQHARRLAERNPGQALRKMDQAANPLSGDHAGLFNLQESALMQVNITTLPAVRVACMRHIGPHGLAVNQFWTQTFVPWCQAQGLLPGAACYGIGLDDPTITPEAQCRYDACVAVPDNFVARSPAFIATLPGGRYAVAAFQGTVPQLTLAWTELLRDWLPASGMQLDGRPLFEHMPPDTRYDPATGVFHCELCIPVKPL